MSTTKAIPAAKDIPLDLDMDCRGCGAQDRTDYVETRSEEIDGRRITWKRTQCKACGQHRINRFASPLPQSRSRVAK